MSNSVEIECLIKSVDFLINSLNELSLANSDLRKLEKEKRLMQNCHGEKVEVDFLIKNEIGEKIGVRQNKEGNYDFILEKETKTSKETVNKIVQAYARLKILNDVKNKGYRNVKEEKLPNGSIRIVVEKWQ